MHALNAVPAAEVAPAPPADVLLAVVEADFVPHPARAMAATEATATIFIDDLKALSLICTTSAVCTERHTFGDSTASLPTRRVGSPGSARNVIRQHSGPQDGGFQWVRSAMTTPSSSRAPTATARSSTTRSP